MDFIKVKSKILLFIKKKTYFEDAKLSFHSVTIWEVIQTSSTPKI